MDKLDLKHCEVCGCLITEKNVYAASTDSCVACRDEIIQKASEKVELRLWLMQLEDTIKELKEPKVREVGFYKRTFEV